MPDVSSYEWRYLKEDYVSRLAALKSRPEYQKVDPRIPGLMLQIESAEALIDKIMEELPDATDD